MILTGVIVLSGGIQTRVMGKNVEGEAMRVAYIFRAPRSVCSRIHLSPSLRVDHVTSQDHRKNSSLLHCVRLKNGSIFHENIPVGILHCVPRREEK
jgi:hypothetical protein